MTSPGLIKIYFLRFSPANCQKTNKTSRIQMHVSVPLCHRSSFVQFCSWNYDVSYDIGVKIACKTDFGLKFSLVVFNLVYWEKYDELKRAKFQPALFTSRTCNEDYFCSMNIRFCDTLLNIQKWLHTICWCWGIQVEAVIEHSWNNPDPPCASFKTDPAGRL